MTAPSRNVIVPEYDEDTTSEEESEEEDDEDEAEESGEDRPLYGQYR